MQVSNPENELPLALKDLYNTLYIKIGGIVDGDDVINLKSDPSTLRVVIESAMTIVEKFRNVNGQGWSGPEKRTVALTLVKFVFIDLAKKGKIDKDMTELVANLDFWGGIVMDVAIDAIKKLFDIGQDVYREGCNQTCSIF